MDKAGEEGRPLKIIQFGGGNFLRAFADLIFQQLNEKTDFDGGVVLVKPTERGDYRELKAQNGDFHTVLEGFRHGKLISEIQKVTVIQEIIHSYAEFDRFLETARIPSIRFIISNTTEAGICFDKNDSFNDRPAKEFPGKLTQWLYARFKHFDGDSKSGCFLMPLELIENNGASLKKCILQYAELWNLGNKFKHWINTNNFFCNTLVDRIVSGYPKNKVAQFTDESIKNDSQLVAGEIYMNWLIETEHAWALKNVLPLEKLGLQIQVVDNLKSYRDMKVRVLNGAHTAMVPVGYLNGARQVSDVMASDITRKFIVQMLSKEINPSFEGLPPEEIKKFTNETVDRFKNPNIAHKLIDISLNSISKFQVRLGPSIRDYSKLYGKPPKLITFSLACLLKFYEGKDQNGEIILLNDNKKSIQIFKKVWDAYRTDRITIDELVDRLVKDPNIFSADFTEIPQLKDQLCTDLDQLLNQPFQKVLKNKLES